MQLKFIKSTACPECGEAEIIKETVECELDWNSHSPLKVRRHVNGGVWEIREFLCGYVLKWIPNYDKEVRSRGCRRNPVFGEAIKHVETLKAQRNQLEEEIRAAETVAFEILKGVD